MEKRGNQSCRGFTSGFTLIELLVVIAIIALLLSIVMPALRKVKESARTAMCKANLKQIGYYIPAYQANNDQKVPIIAHKYNYIAKWSMLSIALRDYCDELSGIESVFDIEGDWRPGATTYYKEYAENYLPEEFVCPSTREKDGEYSFVKEKEVEFGGITFTFQRKYGRDESYVTWVHPRKRGVHWPLDPSRIAASGCDQLVANTNGEYGLPQYGNFNFYDESNFPDIQFWSPQGSGVGSAVYSFKNIAKPTQLYGRGGTLSDTIAIYCEVGQHMYNFGGIAPTEVYGRNHGNHGGGTNALFADMHVEWVNGYRLW